jgi:hypothetical protein
VKGSTVDVVAASMFLFGPLALIAVVLNCAAAMKVLLGHGVPRRNLAVSTNALVGLWVTAIALAPVMRLGYRDWVHLFWMGQFPLVGIFLGSGSLLCRTWRVDAAETGRPWFRSGALLFLAMAVTFGVGPLLLQIAIPEDQPSWHETGAPIRALRELIVWGFGGSLPAALTPLTDSEHARGIGHLPRDVTVPMGTTLIAAWLWIAFSLLALGGRLLRSQRARLTFYLLAPPLLALLKALSMRLVPQAKWGDLESRIWTCDPEVVRSYGPVVLGAGIATVVLLFCLATERAPMRPRDAGAPRRT